MLCLIILAVAAVGCLAQPIYEDCHPTGNSVVVLSNVKMDPYPAKIPGKVKYSFDVELKKPVDNFDFDVTIMKEVDGNMVKIPCVGGVGSCEYIDACSILSDFYPDGKCPPGFTQCACPFEPNKVTISRERVIPALPAEIAPIAAGKYQFKVALKDSSSKSVLACVSLKLEFATN